MLFSHINLLFSFCNSSLWLRAGNLGRTQDRSPVQSTKDLLGPGFATGNYHSINRPASKFGLCNYHKDLCNLQVKESQLQKGMNFILEIIMDILLLMAIHCNPILSSCAQFWLNFVDIYSFFNLQIKQSQLHRGMCFLKLLMLLMYHLARGVQFNPLQLHIFFREGR